MLLADKYADKIFGTITCYDRMIIQEYLPGWSHAEGMTGYLKQMKTALKSSSSVSCGLSARMTGARRSSRKPEKPKG